MYNLYNYFDNILDDVIKNKPLDYQLPLFVNLYGVEYPVSKSYLNYIKILNPRTKEFYTIEEYLFNLL